MKACLFLFITIFSYFPLIAQSYQIYQTATNTSITKEALGKQLAAGDIIIFGEEHGDSITHALQLAVLQMLDYYHNGKIVLSMEMYERDVQGIMDEYLNGWISEKNFIKESRSWSNYKNYKPLIEYAKQYGLPVICANTPARYTNMVTRGGLHALYKLPKATRKQYLPPLPIDTLSGMYYENFKALMGGHMPVGSYIYQSQNLWDATMTYSIQEAVSKYGAPVLHLNGRVHSDYYLGVTTRLKKYYKDKKIITISSFQADKYNPQLHQDIADFVIITVKS